MVLINLFAGQEQRADLRTPQGREWVGRSERGTETQTPP